MYARYQAALLRGVVAFGFIGLCAGAQAQTISTIAGTGVEGPIGDGGPATAASLYGPSDIFVDSAGNRYVSDLRHFRIRKITPAGMISTIAGNGTSGFSGDGGPASSAKIGEVFQLAVARNGSSSGPARTPGEAVGGDGSLYFADYTANRVRKVTTAGIISTIAGTGAFTSTGDGGLATKASLRGPHGVALDAAGNLFVSEYNGHRIRKITPTGRISTIAGTGVDGFSGNGGLATAAKIYEPSGMTFDGAGNLIFADTGNARVRKITPAGIISTVAGNGGLGFSGDGGAATNAALGYVIDVATDATGNLYLGLYNQKRVRKVTPAGIIRTFGGNGTDVESGDGGLAIHAGVRGPYGLAAADGQLYIASIDGSHIRMVNLFASCSTEGYTGAKLATCHQICDVAKPPATLSAMLQSWITQYGSPPPCAR